mgnify:CR=1 FL=1
MILNTKIQGKSIILVALYGPNDDKPEFFKSLMNKINLFDNASIIIGGDFNVPLDYDMDTLNYINKNNLNKNAKIKSILEQLNN